MDEFLKKIKKNKTMLGVSGLVILTAVLLAITLYQKTPTPFISVSREEENFAKTSLLVSDQIRASSESGMFEVDIIAKSNGNEITGGQLEFSFDPKILTKVDIKPGNFLNNPVTMIKSIDAKNGKITYAFGINPGGKGMDGEGVIATISFSKAEDEETFIDFLPGTLITAEQPNDKSVLRDTLSGIIGNLSSPEEDLLKSE